MVRKALPILLLLAASAPGFGARAGDDDLLQPFLGWHCTGCHSGTEPKADLDLLTLARSGPNINDRATLRRIRTVIADHKMPPEERPQPSDDQIEEVLRYIDEQLAAFDEQARAAIDADDPGRVTMRRLNRVEYENTIRDLLGVDVDAQRFLPADDVGYGFDNNGDVLSMTPLLFEKYLDAAERISAQAFPDLLPDAPSITRIAASQMRRTNEPGMQARGETVFLSTTGALTTDYTFPITTRYRLHVEAAGQQAGAEPVKVAFLIDRKQVHVVEVRNGYDEPKPYSFEVVIEAGRHTVGAAFINDYYNPKHRDPRQRDRNCAITSFSIEGPLDAGNATHRAVQPDESLRARQPDRWVRKMIYSLASRGFRRPITQTDLRDLLALADENDLPESRIRASLTAILVSPRFLFRVEPTSGTPRDLDGYELASRLSYFLLSSMPDEELLAAAGRGELSSNTGLLAQTDRLLNDPRSLAIAQNFATQWLHVRDLEKRTPDPQRFASIDDALLASMKAETILLFDAILREDRPVDQLLSCDFTFLNERLAQHYGVPGVRGEYMRRVALPKGYPGGVIAQASVLTATSNPTRTSPVKRGKFILTALLDAPPSPPPPGVASFETARMQTGGGTVREILARHRTDPACAVCHRTMDALGFALEHYNAVGQYRASIGGLPVDALGELPDGTRLQGLKGLREHLLQGTAFSRSLAKHMLTYALGRGVNDSDDATVHELVIALQTERTLRSLIHAIVTSNAFRRGGV